MRRQGLGGEQKIPFRSGRAPITQERAALSQADLPIHGDIQKLTEDEWESLCRHCGFCCLYRVMFEDAAEIYLTRVICPCYDLSAGRCSVYAMRFDVNPECTKITPENLAGLRWLPAHCGYRLASEKKSLAGSPPPLSRKRQKNARKEMERLLGGRVVLYDEEMDLCDYIVGRC